MTRAALRFPVDPRMVPVEKVSRRLGVSVAEFMAKQPELEREGFPRADAVLGTYCLEAVDRWIDRRAGLIPNNGPVSDPAIVLQMAGRKAWRK